MHYLLNKTKELLSEKDVREMSVFNKESKDDTKIKILNVTVKNEIMDKWYEVTLRGQVYRAVETYYECECDWSKNPDNKE